MSNVNTIAERAKAYAIRVDAAKDYKAGYRQALKDVMKVYAEGDSNLMEEFIEAVNGRKVLHRE